MSLIAVISTVGAEYAKRAELDMLTLFLLVAVLWWIYFTLSALGLMILGLMREPVLNSLLGVAWLIALALEALGVADKRRPGGKVSLAGSPPPQEVLASLEPAPTESRNDPPSQTVGDLLFERELKKRCAAFLGAARLAGIEKIGPKIEAAFLGEAPEFGLRAAIGHQLLRWVHTDPRGRYADAIPPAKSLYGLLFDQDERARVESAGLRLTDTPTQEEIDE